MLRKILSVLLSLFLLMSMLSILALPTYAKETEIIETSADSGTSGTITWTRSGLSGIELILSGTGKITSNTFGNGFTEYFPSYEEELYVNASITEIGQGAFSNWSKLRVVYIGDTVKTIESGAFSGSSNLSSVYFSSSVKTIGDSAFSGCNEQLTFYGPYGCYAH